MDRNRSMVKTTRTSLEILETIRALDGARIHELTNVLDVANSTIHRHVVTLERHGYLQRYGETYHISLKLLNFGEYVRSRWPLELIDDVVSELTDKTREEVDFVAESHGRVITIDESYRKYHKWVRYGDADDDDDSKEYRAQIGNFYHMHTVSAGKAILAEYPRSRVDHVVDQWGLPAKTENTITNRSDLFDELEQIRTDGHAVSNEEYATGLRSVGKVVKNPDGSVFGALSVSGPTYRMNGAILRHEVPAALDTVVRELEAGIADHPAADLHRSTVPFQTESLATDVDSSGSH